VFINNQIMPAAVLRKEGNEKEDSFFVFWSIHKYEYYCEDCKNKIWLSE